MFEIQFDGLRNINLFFSRLETALTDFRRFFNDYLTPFVYNRTDNVFETEGFGRWPALDPRYARRKAVTHPNRGILERSGAYRRAATRRNAPGSVLQVSRQELVVGVDPGYFAGSYPALHEGGLGGQKERPVYGLIAEGERFSEEVSELSEKYLREEVAILERSLR